MTRNWFCCTLYCTIILLHAVYTHAVIFTSMMTGGGDMQKCPPFGYATGHVCSFHLWSAWSLCIYCGPKNVTLFHFTAVSTNKPVSVIFCPQDTELICNTTITDLPTSPMYCYYTTSGKHVNFILIGLATKITHYLLHKINIQFLHTTGLHLNLNITPGYLNVLFHPHRPEVSYGIHQ